LSQICFFTPQLPKIIETAKAKIIFLIYSKIVSPVIIHFKNHKRDFNKNDIAVFFEHVLNPSKSATLIFAHMGGDGLITPQTIEIVSAILSYSEKSKLNLYFDLSAIVYKDFFEDFEVSDMEKKLLLEKVGFDRLLFGSDYPAQIYNEYILLLTERLKLSKKELRQILTNNIFEK
jgi:predicted TIM-barrel fold metal-dependent hydrolase